LPPASVPRVPQEAGLLPRLQPLLMEISVAASDFFRAFRDLCVRENPSVGAYSVASITVPAPPDATRPGDAFKRGFSAAG
jgi:hypothetical protein